MGILYTNSAGFPWEGWRGTCVPSCSMTFRGSQSLLMWRAWWFPTLGGSSSHCISGYMWIYNQSYRAPISHPWKSPQPSWSPFFSLNPMIIMGHTIKKTYSCTPSSWRSAWMCHCGTMESRLRQCHHELHLLQVATRQGPRILGMRVASGHPWAQRKKIPSGISKRRWGLMTNHEKRDELMWHEL